MDITQLTIDPDFSQCQRPLSPDERTQLEKNILGDGRVINPIIIWKGTTKIVEGEHRKRIIEKHAARNLPYTVEEMEFGSREEVMEWITNHQTGRRNLDGIAVTMQRAKAGKELGTGEAAKTLNVSERSIQRAKKAEAGLNALPPAVQQRIDKGDLVATERDLRQLAAMNEDAQAKVVAELENDRAKKLSDALPKEKSRKTTLTEEDMQVVSETLSPAINRRIATGSIPATHSDIQKLSKFQPHVTEAIDDLLSAGEVKSVGEAIETLNIPKPKAKPVDVNALKEKAIDLIGKMMRQVDDLARATGKDATACQDFLKLVQANLPV